MIGRSISCACAVTLALSACSSASSPPTSGAAGADGANDAGGALPAGDAKLVLEVPSTFAGTTRELDVVVTPTLPIAGPPAGTLVQIEKPALIAGQPFTVNGDASGVTGRYYVVAVLYMEGGGQFVPANGKDYEAQSPATFAFAGSAIDLGTMTLALAGADAGP